MPKLIKDSAFIDNPWALIAKDESYEQALANPNEAIIIPTQLWLENKVNFQESGKKIGVWLDSDETASLLADDISSLTLIALNFPTFMDGRAYSTAAVLRQRFEYTGELRAIGDVLKDQLSYMKRCGFDSFDISDEVKDEDALTSFKDFANNYQSNIDVPEPLFKRR